VRLFGVRHRVVGGIQALDGVFLAVRRAVLDTIRFDDKTFNGFHLYDVDFTYAAHLTGFRLAVACDLFLLHHSVGNLDDNWRHFAGRFVRKYHDRLPRRRPRTFATAAIYVERHQELLEVMQENFQAADARV